jgi:murein DD-endopeptidase MepM/ murein hydrolase activator NlpD
MDELQALDHQLKGLVNLELEQETGHFQGVGGSPAKLFPEAYKTAKSYKQLVRLLHDSLDNLYHEIAAGKQDKAELHEFLKNQQLLLASTPSIWPTSGWLSSGFGNRASPFTGKREFHNGIDISTRSGASIIAPADGIVSCVRFDNYSGRVIGISHGFGFETVYAHLKKVLVKKGQPVKRGEVVALVGNSGRSTGPHLHYEVHLNKVPVNPLRYVPTLKPPHDILLARKPEKTN